MPANTTLYQNTGYPGNLGGIVGKDYAEVVIRDQIFGNIVPLIFSAADNPALALFYTGKEGDGWKDLGREAKFDIKVRQSASFSAFAEGGSFPGAGYGEMTQSIIPRRRVASKLRIGNEVGELTKNGGGIVDIYTEEAADLVNNWKHNFHRMLHGDSYGLLGQVGVATQQGATSKWDLTLDATPTYPVADCTYCPTDSRWFIAGQMVMGGVVAELIGSTGKQWRVLDNGYNAYDGTNHIVTVDVLDGSTPEAGDWIVMGGVNEVGTLVNSYNAEFQGFAGIKNNALTSFQAVLKASYPDWVSGVIDHTTGGNPVEITEKRLLSDVNKYRMKNGHVDPTHMTLTSNAQLEYWDAMQNNRRFANMALPGGKDDGMVTFNTGRGKIPMVQDDYMPDGSIYLFRKEYFRYFFWGAPGFEDLNGRQWEKSSTEDKAVAIYKAYGNFGTTCRPMFMESKGYNVDAQWNV